MLFLIKPLLTMKRTAIYLSIISLFTIALISCNNSSTSKSDNDKVEETQKEYTVICDNQIIMQGPGEENGGLVNEPATKAIGMETYYAVWNDDTAELLETENGWVKIKLTSGPNHVTGWIPESCLDK